MCDVCSQIPCIQMCCPHGEVFLTDPEDPERNKKCIQKENRYSPTIHDHTGEAISSWNRNEHYLLVAPKEGRFECPVEQMPACTKHFAGQIVPLNWLADPTNFKIFIDGSLNGTANAYDEDYEIIENKTFEVQYKPHEFCVVKTEVESEDISTVNLEFQLFVCKKPDGSQDADDNCEARMITVQATTLTISIVFLLITLIIYLVEPSLKKQYVGSRITIATIVNMAATFIIIVHIHLSKDPCLLHLGEHTGSTGKSKLL